MSSIMNTREIKNLIESYPDRITNLRKTIEQYMIGRIEVYPKSWPLFQCVYHELYLGKSSTIVLCPVCNLKPLSFNGIRKGYRQNCSASCRNRSPEFLKKYKDTCLENFGTEFASQSKKFKKTVESTNIRKYGVDNPMKVTKFKDTHRKSCMTKYGVDNPSKAQVVINKIKETRVSSGDWISDDSKSDLEKYRLAVKKITAKSYHDHYYKINPNNLTRSRYQYHVDHIFSVEEGFKQKVPAEVIGHWTNLRMLWHLDNSIKNTKCHTTLKQLLEQYKLN